MARPVTHPVVHGSQAGVGAPRRSGKQSLAEHSTATNRGRGA